MSQRGFPHSEIPGSKLICSSPGLIAAYRVLHRLLAPRHSPYALSSLTIRNSNLRRRTWNLEPGTRNDCVSFMHTACVWSEKLPFAGYSVVKDYSGGNIAPRNLSVIAGRFPPDPLRSLTRGAPTPHSVRSRETCQTWRLCCRRPSEPSGGCRGPARQARLNAAPLINVENTGLEPVTSWLQTRRSPS